MPIGERARNLIKRLGLQPHPEGGHFAEVFRSPTKVQTVRGERSALTSIYYLLSDEAFSPLHRVPGAEVWCHFEGSPVELFTLDEATGEAKVELLGPRFPAKEAPQRVVPPGVWQAARVQGNSGWALCGCTVGPGFDFQDFEMPSRAELLERLPAHRELVLKLTR